MPTVELLRCCYSRLQKQAMRAQKSDCVEEEMTRSDENDAAAGKTRALVLSAVVSRELHASSHCGCFLLLAAEFGGRRCRSLTSQSLQSQAVSLFSLKAASTVVASSHAVFFQPAPLRAVVSARLFCCGTEGDNVLQYSVASLHSTCGLSHSSHFSSFQVQSSSLVMDAAAEGSAVDVHVFVKLVAESSTSSAALGFCSVNLLTRSLSIGDCVDSLDSFSSLSHMLSLLPPAAQLTLGLDTGRLNAAACAKAKAIATNLGFPPQLAKLSDFRRGEEATHELSRLCSSPHQLLTVSSMTHGLGACAAAIQHLSLLQDTLHCGKWSVSPFLLSEFMSLDAAAASALHVFPTADESDKNASLFGLLNKNRTRMGDRKLRQWLQQPLLSLSLIAQRQRLLSAFIAAPAVFRSEIQDRHLRQLPDYHKVIRAFTSGRAGLQQIMHLWQAVGRLPALIELLCSYSGEGSELIHSQFILPLQTAHSSFDQLDALVSKTIDINTAGLDYALNLRAIPQLVPSREALSELLKAMETERERIEHVSGLEGRISLRDSGLSAGWVLRVSSNDEKMMRGLSGLQSVSNNKQGCSFTTSHLRSLSRQHADASSEYEAQESQFVAQAVAAVATYTPVLEDLSELFSVLDVVVGWAQLCQSSPAAYVQPEMRSMDAGVIEMRQSRHPCVELMDGVHFIPNDISMKRGESQLQIVTGPNMGGKSAAAAAAAAHCLPPAAPAAELCPAAFGICPLSLAQVDLHPSGGGVRAAGSDRHARSLRLRRHLRVRPHPDAGRSRRRGTEGRLYFHEGDDRGDSDPGCGHSQQSDHH